MSGAILRTNSISTHTKELHINKDRTQVYVDLFEHGKQVSTFTIRKGDWESFILSELADLR